MNGKKIVTLQCPFCVKKGVALCIWQLVFEINRIVKHK